MDTTASELERLLTLRTQELQTELARARARYEHAACGLLSIDADLNVIEINQTALHWLGCQRAEVIGQPAAAMRLDDCSRATLVQHLTALRQTGCAQPIEVKLLRRDGSHLPVQLTSCSVHDEQGRFVHSETALSDISERLTVEQRLGAHTRFLQTLTDRIPVRLAYYDKDLHCQFSNAAQAARYGKLPSDLLGSHLSEVVRPDLLPEIFQRVAAALNGHSQKFEAERTQSDGTRQFFEVHYIPDWECGAVQGIFIEVHDISERRHSEEFVLQANRDLEERVRERSAALFQSEQRYRLMVDAIQDYCIYFIDANGLVTEWTESAQRLHGHPRQQMLGRPYKCLLSNDNAGEDELDPDQVLRLAKAHGQWESRGWRLRDDGSRFWALTVLTALRDPGGELQGLSCITRDMTAAKSLEDVMNDLNRELEKRVAERTQQLVAANKDLDVFSHMVSHDLRAPLRHIGSFVSLLQEELGPSSDPLVLQYLGSTAKASKRMGCMIEGLLEYARLGRVALESQPVPLAPLIQGVISHLQPQTQGRTIEWVIEDDLPVVRGDAMLLAQVWGNLLDNAVKYTRARAVARIEVGWRVTPVGGRTFHIKDNGVGFDLEKAHSLFVMFQRQHHSMDFEGTGTGLALTQRIIERHGGRIWAESAPDQGCCFYFTLPFEGVDLTLSETALPELTF